MSTREEIIEWLMEREEEEIAFRDGCNKDSDDWMFHNSQFERYFLCRVIVQRYFEQEATPQQQETEHGK